jgi:hypothetical protein
MARRVVLERPNIEIQYQRFSFDIEGKNFDIVTVPDIVLSIIPGFVYINLTCHLEHAGPSLQQHGISDSNNDEDRQMDDDDLRDYLLLEDFSLSQAKGPISKFLADMPGTMARSSPRHTALCQPSMSRVPLLPCYLKGNTVNTIPYSCRSQIPRGAAAASDSRPDSGTGSRPFEVNI